MLTYGGGGKNTLTMSNKIPINETNKVVYLGN